MFRDSRVLITGGTGSWGHNLTAELLKKGVREIRILSRGELAQVQMSRTFPDERMSFHIGDVRDYEAVHRSMVGVDYVFHLAALKHVPVCEDFPDEAIKTNITGTQNVCRAAIQHGVKKVIDVSTDKAVAPVNLYGMTKAIGERIMINANLSRAGNTKFICIRGGNALGSNGSAVPLFISQVENNNRITLTDKGMTRYFMTLDDAIQLIFKGAEMGIGGEIFVMRMPAFRMSTIAESIAASHGDESTEIAEIGIRPGEKLVETLVSKDESRLTYVLDDDYYLIVPDTLEGKLKAYYLYQDLSRIEMEEYTSSTFLLGREAADEMLDAGGFLK